MAGYEFTHNEKMRIVTALRTVALAQAELWDVLRKIELDRGIEIETDVYLVGELAGGCNFPPSFADLDDAEVWETFEQHSEVK